MSNPAVIILINTQTKSGGWFRVEDNIGESIHIHYDNFRLDLTIEEFLDFSLLMEKSLAELIDLDNFDVKNYDPNFLHVISHMLHSLNEVSFERMSLSKLVISRKGFLGIPERAGLRESRVFRAMNGDNRENNDYIQDNFYNSSNQERVERVNKIVSDAGYPYNDEFIVLFNNDNFIRDGQHRASSLFFQKGNIEVPIIRLKFKDNKYNTKQFLWINSIVPIIKTNLKNILRKYYYKIKKLKKQNRFE